MISNHFKRAYQLASSVWGLESLVDLNAIMPDVFISNYMNIMLFWLLFLTHITRSDKGSLSPRTFKHSELLHKTMYLVLNFKSNLGRYGHDLLAYERDARGCKFAPGCKLCT